MGLDSLTSKNYSVLTNIETFLEAFIIILGFQICCQGIAFTSVTVFNHKAHNSIILTLMRF